VPHLLLRLRLGLLERLRVGRVGAGDGNTIGVDLLGLGDDDLGHEQGSGGCHEGGRDERVEVGAEQGVADEHRARDRGEAADHDGEQAGAGDPRDEGADDQR
jgi:hypothetical protein